MVSLRDQYLPQDKNLEILAQTNITANTNGNTKDFNVPAGVPACLLVIEVGTPTGTTPSLDVELNESTDKFASDDSFTKLMLKGINAAGTYIIPISNRVVRKRSFRPVFKPTGTTPSFPVRAYLSH